MTRSLQSQEREVIGSSELTTPYPSRSAFASSRVERVGGDAGAVLGPGMVLRKRLCTRSIAASRAALKESYGLLIRQHIQRDLIGYFTPVRKPGRDQHTCPSGWQKVWYLIRRADIVVNEEPCRALFRQSSQRSLRSLLNVGFFCCCATQRHTKARKSTQEPGARFGRTPANARI
jgi:hypothetical protein